MIIRGNLILVLMEDALRADYLELNQRNQNVLILVLMENALRTGAEPEEPESQTRLNPCSNGRCSASPLPQHCWAG